jgi:hypothetical protein
MKVNDLKTAVILGMKENFETWNEFLFEGDELCVTEGEFNSNILLCETAEDVRNEVKSCFKENGCEAWQAAQFYAEVLEALVVTE